MLNFLARDLVVVGVLGFEACSGSDSHHAAPHKPDAAQADAARSGDAEVLDSGGDMQLMDAGEQAAADSGAKQQDSDAERHMDSSTGPHDAGHDSGSHYVDDDSGPGQSVSEDTFTMRVVASGLAAPWEITWGPDARLWITERTGGRVIRMDPANGTYSVALTLSECS